ncbi:hypothetical protein [Allocoleopsis sp.]|uniref:hypothetical protein n=1 Tax=Allocoleopsis sp. TaxID=3088169 RepID=UPI002FD300E6
MKTVQRLQKVLLGYFAVTVSGVAVMPDTLRLSLGLPLIAVALSGLAAFTWLKFWLEPN